MDSFRIAMHPAHLARHVLFLLLSCLLSACVTRPPNPGLYDLGPLPASATGYAQAGKSPALPAIALTDPRSPSWLASPLMFYRLLYANDQQARAYAESRWVMPPAQLFRQRLAARIADAGGVVASSRDSGPTLPVLQIEIDDFSHVFTTPQSSTGQLSLRASLFNGRKLVAQRTFRQQVPAATGDANGGAQALSRATDAAIAEMLQWLAASPARQP